MNPQKSAEDYFHRRFQNRARGFPIATIAYYGPDHETATKVAVGILDRRNEVMELRTWHVRALDVRIDREISNEILAYVQVRHVQRVVIAGKILGCPHEEGIDYPEGETCPQCPYWARIDRWSGKPLPK
jgi:hypothetical protein